MCFALIGVSIAVLAMCFVFWWHYLHARDPFGQARDGTLIGKRLCDVERLCGPARPVRSYEWTAAWQSPTGYLPDNLYAAAVRVDPKGVITDCAYMTVLAGSPGNFQVLEMFERWPRSTEPAPDEQSGR